jgi:hypothetical protein
MQQLTTPSLPLTIGLDLGNTNTQAAVYGTDGERLEERKVTTNREQLAVLFERFPGARIVMEASTASRWIHNLAVELGHEVITANPRNIPIITSSVKKCDRNDARLLAEIGQVKPSLLSPVHLREDRYQIVRALLLARAQYGDRYMRSLLVSAATRILASNGADSDLRRFGERIIGDGGRRAKARARIAVARKLGVLLHRLLCTAEVYEPLRNNPEMSTSAA